MKLTETEARLREQAIDFARSNKKRISKKLTDPDVYVPENNPVSVFMAGSPGAGKTEASKRLLERFKGQRVLRIDPDDLRAEFPNYDGANSWLFQGAVSILVDRVLDLAFRQSQSFVLDGTLAARKISEKNIERSITQQSEI